MNVKADIITSTQITDVRAVFSITVVVIAWLGLAIPVRMLKLKVNGGHWRHSHEAEIIGY